MARLLFVHQNFPGQFPHIADAAVAAGHEVRAIGSRSARPRPGVEVRGWALSRGTTPGIFDPATRAEADLLRGGAAAEVASRLKAKGYEPDLIIGHPGWGETIHLSEVFPETPQILFGEFYYRAVGADVHFDPEFETWSLASAMRVHAKNATLALAYADASAIVCPTPFQASTLPAVFQPLVRILHEGVDLDRARRKAQARLRLPDGRVLDGSRPVITFINRTLERLRGFHVFMRALPALLAAQPDAEVVIIGQEEGRGYGSSLREGETWKSVMLAELGDRIDLSRVHFVGRVPHEEMIRALSISWAHVYLTCPFVLSWSLVEAMGCGCLIVASDTAPVRDAIEHGVNGLLVDFFDPDALARTLIEACEDPRRHDRLRAAAQTTARSRFDRATVGVPGWMALIDEFAGRRVQRGPRP